MEYGLIGGKLGHSHSKTIHERIADYSYHLLALDEEAFQTFMKERAFQAINVTIPYKQAVIPYLDEMDDRARAIGAVNTIVQRDGKLIGYNTDFSGFLYMMRHRGIRVKGKKAVVLGNGGAAKAVLAVLREQEAAEIPVVDVFASHGAITREECHAKHTDANLVINTSPVGMYPNVDASPFDGSPLELSQFGCCEAVIDVIYNPLETKLTKRAKELGMDAVTGLKMLVAQAVHASELFQRRKLDPSLIEDVHQELLQTLTNG